MHDSVIDFKIDEFCAVEFEGKVGNNKLLERIREEYRVKMHEVNGKEIKKMLEGSVGEYLRGVRMGEGNDDGVRRYQP